MSALNKFKNYGQKLVGTVKEYPYPHTALRLGTTIAVMGYGFATGNADVLLGGSVVASINTMADGLNENYYNAASKLGAFRANCAAGTPEQLFEDLDRFGHKARQAAGTLIPAIGAYLMFQDNKFGHLLFWGNHIAKGIHYAVCGNAREQKTKEIQRQLDQQMGSREHFEATVETMEKLSL